MKLDDRRQLIERSYEAWGSGDLDTLFEIYDPECEWDNRRLGLPDIPPFSRGHEEMAEFRRVSLGMFPDVFPVALEIVDLGDDRVLVDGEWRSHGDATRFQALAAFGGFAQICEFRDGLISRVVYFPSAEEARAVERG